MRLKMQKTSTQYPAIAQNVRHGNSPARRARLPILATMTLMIAGFTGASFAATDVYLQAQTFDKALPGDNSAPTTVPMWGYQWCREGFNNCGQLAASQDAPGPQINPSTINFGVQADASGVTLTEPGNPGVTISGLAGNGNPADVSRGRMGIGVANVNVGNNQTVVFTYDVAAIPQSFSIWTANGDPSTLEVTLDGNLVTATVVQGPLESLPTTHENANGGNGWYTYRIAGAASGMALAIKNTGGGAAFRVKEITAAPAAAYAAGTGPSLTIHLRNTLRTPTSIMIPGQAGGGNPVMAADSRGRSRMQSFTTETERNGDQQDYVFNNLRPGTYIYQSGTQPSIQVPMGLYGALVVDAGAGEPYPGVANDTDAILLFSEIDPLQNQRAADALAASLGAPGEGCVSLADYQANGTVGFPCTVDYNPTIRLVNGEASPSTPLAAGDPSDTVLFRFLNAGLRTHIPAIVGPDMKLVAEDGNPYPGLGREQSHALLPAGKTLDALVDLPATDLTFALYDRMSASNGGTTGPDGGPDALPAGGLLVKINAGAGSNDPGIPTVYAVNDVYAVTEDLPLNGTTVLANDVMLAGATVAVVNGPSNGTLNMNGDGSFTYTPNVNFSGADGFTYRATLGGVGYPAHATLNVSFENDAPVATADGPYTNATGTGITVDAAAGVLGNDSDPDGDTLTAVIVDGTAPDGLTLNADGSFEYTGVTAAPFYYRAVDQFGLQSEAVAVELAINPVAGIALNVLDGATEAAVTDFRWLVQEDAMFHHDPSAPAPLTDQQSLNFHKSYMPIVAQGNGAAEFAQVALDPAKYYYVSVLPSDGADGDGHSIGGAQILPGATVANVYVSKQPIPTAQLSVLVFNDNFPTNGAPDANEPGLGGFEIVLEDAGGRYGISGGTMSQDAFGAPLKNWLDCAPPATAGVILTCEDGSALIRDLPPGKYGVIAVKPLGGPNWVQTSTIEGTKVIDAWVQANEPEFFLEFGGAAQHAFIGFVDPATTNPPVAGSASITGNITLLHDPRPPAPLGSFETGSYDALAHTRAWVGLNDNAGDGQNVRTVHADPEGNFSLDGIPDGNYQIVVWDDYLDQIIAFQLVDITGGASVNLTDPIAVNAWFTRTEHNVFVDDGCGTNPLLAGNGVRDDCGGGVMEAPLQEQAVNLRWRDGTVNQSFPTDLEGFVPFDQAFPFFSWQIYEIDYTRMKPTGVNVIVDGGGDVKDPANPYQGLLNPQVQPGGALSRTELGSTVLLEAYQGFPGQTSIFNWGKIPYQPGENGGIAGIVFYGSTRGENDPRLTVGDPWEPGIPGVKVRLYREVARSAPFNIGVANASFEGPALPGSGTDAVNPPTSWTKTGGGEILQPSNQANVTDGIQSFRFTTDGSVEQQLGSVLKKGTYELSVAVGDQGAGGITIADYRVQLGVMQGATFVLLAEDNNSLAPDQGFLTSTVSYTATDNDPGLGLPLVIRLSAYNTSATEWVLFDQVSLSLMTDTALTLVSEITTDSWDGSQPEGCPGEDPASPFTTDTLGLANIDRCYDGFRNWNQVRPGVFDGGYAFNDIPAGTYVVEVVPPAGYELIKEEDVNVGFGDTFASVAVSPPAGGPGVFEFPDAATVSATFAPEPGLIQPPCVGDLREVPATMSLFPAAAEPAPFAGALRPLCNRKQVVLSDQGQAAADFHLFTTTPVAGQYTGLVLDDISNETDPRSPGFGEKWGPANLPVSLRDWTGREVYRTYGDAYGRYNGVLPSTFSANIPIPSGYSPAMMTACMNDPGDGAPDPLKLASYGTACYTAQFMPGTTTYLDTPILPQAAFAGGFNPVDCKAPTGTPVIASVETRNNNGFGAWLNRALGGANRDLIITSAGTVAVSNPAYEGPQGAAPATIDRDFGFGDTVGTVTIGGIAMPMQGPGWSNDTIRIRVPNNFEGSGELVVTRANGNSSVNAVTVTRSLETPIRVPGDYATIQAAIDAAGPGSLILVGPGTYNEQVIMWKPVRLQGSGAATIINAIKRPVGTLQAWIDKVAGLVGDGVNGDVDLLPGQLGDFATEQGAGVTVLAKKNGPNRFPIYPSRIDGFTITGADSGGGIFVNGYADGLEISNNNIIGNSGFLHGGIRVGVPFLPDVGLQANANGIIRFNDNLNIHHNAITLNGATGEQSVGGGLAIATGTWNYRAADNFICGNYNAGDGAGIAHLGQSNSGLIEHNQILFNQSFDPTATPSGGGIFIGGEPPAPPALTLGTGSVIVDGNLIQGNHAGSGHGGGIRTQFVNGSEMESGNPWRLRITNNMIVNNVAGYAGAGISMVDTVRAQIINNTIANNDSTATVGGLIVGSTTSPQPAGISAERNSLALAAVLPPGSSEFSEPLMLVNNIIWHNRSFSYDGTKLVPDLAATAIGECAGGANYWDLGVLGEPQVAPGLQLDPRRSILTDTTGYHGSNVNGDPDFLSEYCNGARTLSTPGPMGVQAAFGEGGNLLDVRYGPLTQAWPANTAPWNYHIGAASAGRDNGNDTSGPVPLDFDGDARPQGTGTPSGVDRGADEYTP